GGIVSGVCAIFATVDTCAGHPVHSIFNPNDLNDYETYPSHDCPMCREGQKIDALVNSFGYSKL
ncbi:MAG: orotate phosphoribosyltransferase, partial [Clostridia bacterium]|nr:orotate phosphoribosyltransferase [Clostridia bacterium]